MAGSPVASPKLISDGSGFGGDSLRVVVVLVGPQCRSPHPKPASLVFVEGRELPEGVMWLRHDDGPHSGSGRRGEEGRREVREPPGLTESEASPRIGQPVRKE